MPASLRVFTAADWTQPLDADLPDEFRAHAAHSRWRAARQEWRQANGVDVVDAFRTDVAEKLARLRATSPQVAPNPPTPHQRRRSK